MKNFILIDHEPWTKWRKKLFYDLFEKAGVNLIVWDLSRWLLSGLTNPDELLDENYLTKIESEAQFRNLINLCDPQKVIFIEELFRVWENRTVFKILNEGRFSTIKIELYGNTVLKEPLINKIKALAKLDFSVVAKNRINMLKYKLYNKKYKIREHPNIVISSNGILSRDFALNHPDYDKFMFDNAPRIIDGDYIVFSDIYFPYHPDNKFFFNYKSLPDGKHYYEVMSRYFDFIEEKYGFPVIIAAHPKASYRGDEFGDRKIIKYQTESLIKYCSMVTMHRCNTVSYAVLGNKPISFVATDDYLSLPNSKRKLELLATLTLGLKVFNIETSNYQKDFKFETISTEKRTEYIYNYLTSKDTEKTPNHVNLKSILFSL